MFCVGDWGSIVNRHRTVPTWSAKFNWGGGGDRWGYSLTWYTWQQWVCLLIFTILYWHLLFVRWELWFYFYSFPHFFLLQIFLFCTYIVLYILYMMTSVVSTQARGTRDRTLPTTTTQTTQPQKQIQVGFHHCTVPLYKVLNLETVNPV